MYTSAVKFSVRVYAGMYADQNLHPVYADQNLHPACFATRVWPCILAALRNLALTPVCGLRLGEAARICVQMLLSSALNDVSSESAVAELAELLSGLPFERPRAGDGERVGRRITLLSEDALLSDGAGAGRMMHESVASACCMVCDSGTLDARSMQTSSRRTSTSVRIVFDLFAFTFSGASARITSGWTFVGEHAEKSSKDARSWKPATSGSIIVDRGVLSLLMLLSQYSTVLNLYPSCGHNFNAFAVLAPGPRRSKRMPVCLAKLL